MENDWKVGKVYYAREERPEEGRVNALRSGPLRKKYLKKILRILALLYVK